MIDPANYVLYGFVGKNATVQKFRYFSLDTVVRYNTILRNLFLFGWKKCVDTQGNFSRLNDSNGKPLSLAEMDF